MTIYRYRVKSAKNNIERIDSGSEGEYINTINSSFWDSVELISMEEGPSVFDMLDDTLFYYSIYKECYNSKHLFVLADVGEYVGKNILSKAELGELIQNLQTIHNDMDDFFK